MDKNDSVSITKEGATQALLMQEANPDFSNLPLRLYLEGKGCDGFYYGVTFDAQTNADHVFQSETITIVVDPDTMQFVQGAVIEWVDDERGRGFLVNNPDHRKFRGKFYKKSAWQKALLERKAQAE